MTTDRDIVFCHEIPIELDGRIDISRGGGLRDLDGVIAANAVGLPYVVIGGFSVIAHGYLRATKDSDLSVPGNPRPPIPGLDDV